MPLIRLEGISKHYFLGKDNVVAALDDVSFEIGAGEMVAIMGPSGSGKSTLMDIIGCLSTPTYGTYELDDINVSVLDDEELAAIRNAKIGFVFQNFNLLPRLPAVANVELPLLYRGIEKEARFKRSVALLERVGLSHRIHHDPNELSGGERQRVAIARALVGNPALVLADEPTGNLDSKSSAEIMRIFKELNAEGRTIILVTHDPEVARQAKRILSIRDGKIQSDEHLDGRQGHVPAAKIGGQEGIVVSQDTLEPGSRPQSGAAAKAKTILGHKGRASLKEGVNNGMRNLLHNKLRSFLTMLGIIIGVAAVIGMLSIGEGAKRQVTSQIQELGSNLIIISPKPIAELAKEEKRKALGLTKGLTNEDADTLARSIPQIKRVCPESNFGGWLRYKGEQYFTSVKGTSENFPYVRTFYVGRGRFFSKADADNWANVCVIGTKVQERLFGSTEDPLGKTIKVGNERLTVIGIMERKEKSIFVDPNDQMFLPITTIQKRFTGNDRVQAIYLETRELKQAKLVQALVTSILKARHNGLEDFTIRTQEEFLKTMERVTGTFTVLLGGIALISLLIGGIGIMNIMLVTVTERTREIGIRKAIGASRKDVLSQFLIEAISLSIIGGLFGILLGVGLGFFVSKGLASALKTSKAIESVISLKSILLATGFSAAVGIFFGIYPANKASRLDPVEALRYE